MSVTVSSSSWPRGLDRKLVASPLRHRKAALEHLAPGGLLTVVIKNLVLQGAMRLSVPEPEPLPSADKPKEVATYLADMLWWPVTKDLLVTSVQRFYEHLIADVWLAKEPAVAGRFVYKLADASAETYEAALAQEKATAGGATVIGFLRARLAAAVYTGFRVAPYSSMLTNAALCTVEEGALLARAMHKAYRRRAATAKMNKREATLVEQTAARLELLELEKTSGPGVVVAGLEMAGRCAGSVVSEVACTTVGAFLAPGVGALVGQLLGSVVCWLL